MIMKVNVETKRVQDKQERKDGYRVLVTRSWPRGVRLDQVNVWLKDLGPTRPLFSAFKNKKMRWPTFEKKYLEELEGESARLALISLAQGINAKAVTLLCSCDDLKRCHTKPLKKHLTRWIKGL